MRAEVLAIGTELLMGETVDTNSAYLAAHLPALGIELHQVTLVRDLMPEMVEALRRALARSDLVLATGGLGPTDDDLTREAIAAAIGEEAVEDPALVAALEARFRERGVEMPLKNLKQATLAPSAEALPNSLGTAPGWWVEKGGRTIVALPGVSSELEAIWTEHVAPRLARRPGRGAIYTRTIKTFGLPESAVAERLPGLFDSRNPYLGIYARPDGIHLRLIASAPSEEEARRIARPMEEAMERALGDVAWGADADTPEERLGFLLRGSGLTIAAMESCTGGLLASAITDVPGSSDYFRGGIVAYATDLKVRWGVDPALVERHGVVSQEVAGAMARAARVRLGADVGIGTTGVAGPGEVEGHAPGTVFIGVDMEGASLASQMRFPRDRLSVKRRAVTQALLQACRMLRERAVR